MPKRILLAEDEDSIRHSLERILKRAGYTVCAAADGHAALQLARQTAASGETYDLLILDVQMPRMDGVELHAQLKAAGFCPPTIVITGNPDTSKLEALQEQGCESILMKPFTGTMALAEIARILGTDAPLPADSTTN